LNPRDDWYFEAPEAVSAPTLMVVPVFAGETEDAAEPFTGWLVEIAAD
jgi:hypothetical protein